MLTMFVTQSSGGRTRLKIALFFAKHATTPLMKVASTGTEQLSDAQKSSRTFVAKHAFAIVNLPLHVSS